MVWLICFIFSEWIYTYCSTRITCLVSRPVVCFEWVFSTLFYTSCEMLLYTLMNKEKQKSLIFFLFYSFLKYCGSCIINKYLYTSWNFYLKRIFFKLKNKKIHLLPYVYFSSLFLLEKNSIYFFLSPKRSIKTSGLTFFQIWIETSENEDPVHNRGYYHHSRGTAAGKEREQADRQQVMFSDLFQINWYWHMIAHHDVWSFLNKNENCSTEHLIHSSW